MPLAVNNRNTTSHSATETILMQESDYIAKNLELPEEKSMAYQLRHNVFCEELGWREQTQSGLEIDSYDTNAVFFAVFDKRQEMVASLRLILPGDTFMLEKEFSCLVSKSAGIKKQSDRAEVSRLCVAPQARNGIISCNFQLHTVSMFLYKSVYHWCLVNHIRYLYFVVEDKVCRLLRAQGFPCKSLGEPKKWEDGMIAVAAIMDWREFEKINSAKKPELLYWFQARNQANLPPGQGRQHAFC